LPVFHTLTYSVPGGEAAPAVALQRGAHVVAQKPAFVVALTE
jgi:hypothetical protein